MENKGEIIKYRGLLKTLSVMLNLFQYLLSKAHITRRLRVKPAMTEWLKIKFLEVPYS
jgi:hypothetical protein